MKLYISGPMSNQPDLNYPLFNRVAAQLRAMGHEVINPAENPEPPCKSWAGYMRMAIPQVVGCEGIVLLAGWSDSRGARLEVQIAESLEMRTFRVGDVIHEPMKSEVAARSLPHNPDRRSWLIDRRER